MNVLNRIPSYFLVKKALPYHLFFLPLQRNKGSIAQKRLYKWLIQLLQHKQPCDGLPTLQGIFYNADIRGSISADPLRHYQAIYKTAQSCRIYSDASKSCSVPTTTTGAHEKVGRLSEWQWVFAAYYG